jgi:hypothetical protein
MIKNARNTLKAGTPEGKATTEMAEAFSGTSESGTSESGVGSVLGKLIDYFSKNNSLPGLIEQAQQNPVIATELNKLMSSLGLEDAAKSGEKTSDESVSLPAERETTEQDATDAKKILLEIATQIEEK